MTVEYLKKATRSLEMEQDDYVEQCKTCWMPLKQAVMKRR